MKQSRNNFTTVFTQRKYLLIAAGVFLFFYILNVILLDRTSFSTVLEQEGIRGAIAYIGTLMYWYQYNGTLYHIIILDLTCLLLGILAGLIAYKTDIVNDQQNKQLGVIASFSFFLGIFSSSCLACGIGLFSVLGIGAATLSLLPYRGAELGLIAVLILIGTIIYLSRHLYVCKIRT